MLATQYDWIEQATDAECIDPDHRVGAHYSWYIDKYTAGVIARDAIAANDPFEEYVDNYCDENFLYGAAREEVMLLVDAEYTWIHEYLEP